MKESIPAKDGSSQAFLDIKGIKTRYKVSGVGEQLLLLHGWGGSIESMKPLFDRLAKYYTVFAIDFPGHGETGFPPKGWSIAEFSEYLLCVMDALDIGSPYVIAHSFGGRVAIKLAVSHPERVKKIILVDSAGVKPPRAVSYYVKSILARLGKYGGKYLGKPGEILRDSLYAAVGSRDYVNSGRLRETFVKVVSEDLGSALVHIKSPTLLVWGENDRETPIYSAKVMERLIPNSKLVILKDAGHFSYIDQFGKFCLVVEKFLRE